MGFLSDKCTLKTYNKEVLEKCESFDCGNDDLNEFFSHDVIHYTAELMGKFIASPQMKIQPK